VVGNRVPTLSVTKISRTFQNPKSIFPWPHHMPAMFEYKDKQQLLWGPPAIFLYMQIKSELVFANVGIWHLHHCVCLPHNSLGNSSTKQTHFLGLSRAWKFYKMKSRTFQEAWEPCGKSKAKWNHNCTRVTQ